MKKIRYVFLLLLLPVVAQAQGNPIYTGPLNSTVRIPLVYQGRQFSITGTQLMSAIDTGVVPTLQQVCLQGRSTNTVLTCRAAVDTNDAVILSQLLQVGNPNPSDATVGLLLGAVTITPVIHKNTYGYVEIENPGGVPAGTGAQIKVAYSAPYTGYAIPTVTVTGTSMIYVPMLVIDPHTDSFIVELQDDIPAGGAIGFTYQVKAF